MKIDNNSSLYNVVDIAKNAPTKQESVQATKPSTTKTVDLNQYDQALISESNALLKSAPAVDVDRVADIKAQIQSGQLTFDMGELARVLANLS